LQNSLVIVAFRLGWRVWKAVNAGWLAGVFMKQLACHLHWDWHSTASNANLFDSFQLTTMHAISACLFGHAILLLFHLLLFNYYHLMLCFDSV
jgi:hypothetical protein